VLWRCRCECGNETVAPAGRLRDGTKLSCGCARSIAAKGRVKWTRHGATVNGIVTPEYRSWANAKQRATNPSNRAYPEYGGRGIGMAVEWLNDFRSFLAHIGPRPEGTSLDRIDNDRGYEPGNVRWATRGEQARNRRARRWGARPTNA
jgi:hypothetical protein